MGIRAQKNITVVTACVVRDDQVLLVRRSEPALPDAHRKWEFPGGVPEPGESNVDAVAREVREETGLSVEVVDRVPFVVTNRWSYPAHDLDVTVVCYVCRPGETVTLAEGLDEQVSESRWMRIAEVDVTQTLRGIGRLLAWFSSACSLPRTNAEPLVYVQLINEGARPHRAREYVLCEGLDSIRDWTHLRLFPDWEQRPEDFGTHRFIRGWGLLGGRLRCHAEQYLSLQTSLNRLLAVLTKKLANGYILRSSNLGETQDQVVTALKALISHG